MKKIRFFAGLMMVCMVLCGTGRADIHQQIMGSWVGDVDTAMAEQNMDPAAADDPMVQMLKAMLEGMKVEFGADSISMEVSMMGDTQQLTMGYEILETTDETLKIKNLDGPKAGVVSVITVLGDDQIRIAEENGRQPPTYLKRVGGASAQAVAENEVQVAEPEEEEEIVEEETVQEQPQETVVLDEPVEPVFMVVIPEQIDTEWYWYYYTEVEQDIVQANVEKYLTRAGMDVLDLNTLALFADASSVENVLEKDRTLEKARAANATYLVLGKASAVMQGRSMAYGIEVIRSQAQAMARIIRVSDGTIIDVVDAEAEDGGQAQKATGQAALRKAGKKLGRAVARVAQRISEEGNQ